MNTAFLVLAVVSTLGVVVMVFGVGITRIRQKSHYSRKEYVLLLALCATGIAGFFGWAMV
jgi:uncharacterized membrane protein